MCQRHEDTSGSVVGLPVSGECYEGWQRWGSLFAEYLEPRETKQKAGSVWTNQRTSEARMGERLPWQAVKELVPPLWDLAVQPFYQPRQGVGADVMDGIRGLYRLFTVGVTVAVAVVYGGDEPVAKGSAFVGRFVVAALEERPEKGC